MPRCCSNGFAGNDRDFARYLKTYLFYRGSIRRDEKAVERGRRTERVRGTAAGRARRHDRFAARPVTMDTLTATRRLPRLDLEANR